MADVKVFTIDEAYEDIVKSKGPWKRGKKAIDYSKWEDKVNHFKHNKGMSQEKAKAAAKKHFESKGYSTE